MAEAQTPVERVYQRTMDALREHSLRRKPPLPPLAQDPLLHATDNYCRRMACRRAILEGEATHNTCEVRLPPALRALLAMEQQDMGDGDEGALDRLLADVPHWYAQQQIDEHFAALRNASVNGRTRGRIAVLLPGAVRNMLEPAHLAEFGEVLSEWQRSAQYMHAFAYLALSAEVGCFTADCAGGGDTRNVDALRVAFESWGVGLDLELHLARAHDKVDRMWPPPIASVCLGQAAWAKQLATRFGTSFGSAKDDAQLGRPQLHREYT